MTERTGRPWLNYLLGLLCVGAVVVAILVVGPASGSQTAATRTAKAAQGVVQSTVSGSGNLQPASQLNLGFKTGGTVTNIYVSQGEHVTQGRLLATLNPQSAEVTLEQAKASLLSAEASLVKEEDPASTTPVSSTSTSSAPTSSAPTSSTPRKGARSTHEDKENETSSSSSSQSSTVSTAQREANLASARAAVKSDKLTVQSAEEAVQDTKLYAPGDGTIVSLSGQVGEVVAASGTTKASSGSSSSGSSGSGTSTSGGGASSSGRPAATGASSSSSASNSSSSSFAVLSDLSSMQLIVALNESEIGHVKVGQIATVTVEALEGSTLEGTGKLAAHVSEVAILSTSSSGVVSYDVTFQLDQMQSGLKPGMSATAEVVVKQAEGVNVPTSAITAGSVTVVRGGKDVRERVTTGLAGNSSTI
ncbi:MAG: biotin/lipoyl-binding protein, partial [Solirubrobacteraceae bacterium]